MKINQTLRRCFTKRLLHVNDERGTFPFSSLSVCMFGATGFLGEIMAHTFGQTGADIIFPHRIDSHYDEYLKALRLSAPLGSYYLYNGFDFADPNSMARAMKNCNVVVNLIGAKRSCRKYDDFYEANVEIPRRIAAHAKKQGILRLIHFSALGADLHSSSLDLATKAMGEQAVRAEFPEATILRPGLTLGFNDHFTFNFLKASEFFWTFMPVYGNLSALRHPILEADVSSATYNVLRLPDSAGQTYELGGEKVHSIKELYEIMINILQKPLKFIKFNRELALKVSRFASWKYFSYLDLQKEEIDIIVTRKNGEKGIEDLFVKPGPIENFINDSFYSYRQRIAFTKDDFNTL